MLWKPKQPPTKDVPPHEVRWLRPGDGRRVLEIDAASGYRLRLDASILGTMLANRSSSARVLCLAGEEPIIAGYVIYTLARPAIRIDRLAIDPTLRRRGLGTALVQSIPCGQLIRQVLALIRAEDLDGTEFARALGMRAVGIHRGPPEIITFALDPHRERGKAVNP